MSIPHHPQRQSPRTARRRKDNQRCGRVGEGARAGADVRARAWATGKAVEVGRQGGVAGGVAGMRREVEVGRQGGRVAGMRREVEVGTEGGQVDRGGWQGAAARGKMGSAGGVGAWRI